MKRRKNPEKEVAAWNAKVGVGDTVEYRGYPEAEPQIFTTRTAAEVLSGHTAVVWLNGKSGCVCVDACRKVATRADEWCDDCRGYTHKRGNPCFVETPNAEVS